jgi:hypothetical protein
VNRSRSMVGVVALVVGLLIGASGTQVAYWLDACVAQESNGSGTYPGLLNRCRE